MVSSSLLRLAMSCGQTGLLVIDPPNYLAARCSSVEGTVPPIDCFVPIVRPSACGMYNFATPSLVIVSLHGINNAALVQSWSVIVSIESYPLDVGSFVMKSIVTTSNGCASGSVVIGKSFGFWWCVLILLAWHVAHPLTYSSTSFFRFGHQ